MLLFSHTGFHWSKSRRRTYFVDTLWLFVGSWEIWGPTANSVPVTTVCYRHSRTRGTELQPFHSRLSI